MVALLEKRVCARCGGGEGESEREGVRKRRGGAGEVRGQKSCEEGMGSMKTRKREASSRPDLERQKESVCRKGINETIGRFELEVSQNWGSDLKGWYQKSLPTPSRYCGWRSAETSYTNPRLVGKYGMSYSRAREYSSICWKKALNICGVIW